MGLNVVVGSPGCSTSATSRFYAVGAYSYALLATNFGLSFWVCLPRPASSPRSGRAAGFPVCGCAATTSPLSRWRSARSSVRHHPIGKA